MSPQLKEYLLTKTIYLLSRIHLPKSLRLKISILLAILILTLKKKTRARKDKIVSD